MKKAAALAQADHGHDADALNVAAKRQIFIDALEAFGEKQHPTLVNVEGTEPGILKRMSTNGTILQVGIQALRARGVPIEPTVGAVMSHLEIDQGQIHAFTCYCSYGDWVSGYDASFGLAQAISA